MTFSASSAARPTSTARPADPHATVAARLGIDPDREGAAPLGRPMKLVNGGRIVTELLS